MEALTTVTSASKMIVRRTNKRALEELRESHSRDPRSWFVPHIVMNAYADSHFGRFLRPVGRGDGIADTIWQCILYNVKTQRDYGLNLMLTARGMGDRIVYKSKGAKPTLRHYVREAKILHDGHVIKQQLYKKMTLQRIRNIYVQSAIDYTSRCFKQSLGHMVAIHYRAGEEVGVWYLPIFKRDQFVWVYNFHHGCCMVFEKWNESFPDRTSADYSRMAVYLHTMNGIYEIRGNHHTWDLDLHVKQGYL